MPWLALGLVFIGVGTVWPCGKHKLLDIYKSTRGPSPEDFCLEVGCKRDFVRLVRPFSNFDEFIYVFACRNHLEKARGVGMHHGCEFKVGGIAIEGPMHGGVFKSG